MKHLIRRDGPLPPGGFHFTDPRTGFRFPPMDGGFDEQVSRIIRHRRANPRLYPPEQTSFLNPVSVANELDLYQCLRLGNNPKFCTDGAIPVKPDRLTRPSNRLCPRCNTAMIEVLCPTCGSPRTIAHKCPSCGLRIDK